MVKSIQVNVTTSNTKWGRRKVSRLVEGSIKKFSSRRGEEEKKKKERKKRGKKAFRVLRGWREARWQVWVIGGDR